MTRSKKRKSELPDEQHEASYWDSHGAAEHFRASDFEPLQARRSKDTPITIRLDSESRRQLEEIAKAQKVGPSTLARMLIANALKQWLSNGSMPATGDGMAEESVGPLPQDVRQEVMRVFDRSKAGNSYRVPESKLEKLGKALARCFAEATGYRIVPDKKSPKG